VALFECAAEAGVRTIVFSSSATVYGEPASVPIREDFPLSASNPYGRSKLMIEEVLRDLAQTDAGWRVAFAALLQSGGRARLGLIGEDPNDIPNNLMPYIAQVAVGKLQELPVIWRRLRDAGRHRRARLHPRRRPRPRPPGGVECAARAFRRDDREPGHRARLQRAGNGAGICRRERQTRALSYRGAKARDIAQCYADPALALATLGWQAQFGIGAMCADTLRWQRWAAENFVTGFFDFKDQA